MKTVKKKPPLKKKSITSTTSKTKGTTLHSEPIRNLKIGKCSVTILGTAHVSKKSIEAVEEIVKKEKPDTICVELCDSRLTSVRDPEHWKKLDIFKVFKQRKMYLLLSTLILSSFQKKIGKGEVKPGDEMRKAIQEADRTKAKLITVDREVQTTLKRAWGNVGFFSKMYLLSALITSLLVKEDVTEEKIEEMKSDDALKDLFSQLPKRYEHIKNVIIDERDEYLAEKIRNAASNSKKLLAVVGAGHLEGILTHIHEPKDISHLDIIPVKTILQRISGFVLPLLILGLLSYTFYSGGKEKAMEFAINWVVVKGSLAALGALIALAHPVSILLAFVVAPLGNFNPILKPGWVAALSESYFRKPIVEDFENIATDSENFTGYWKNRVIRIFLVFMLPQLGSSIGTFIVTYKGFTGLF
ncbi:MAG: TraB/GumN family protein [Leptospiraceae bacterium]|nr:TraB/GumN family protein [Leptospiraceae bacterium]MCK6380966.1 TraB/GumN family protein [Leptospiraceae bacterium]NUM40939.1 TraB/GumN family protein [Leptospiraceae bacterium]